MVMIRPAGYGPGAPLRQVGGHPLRCCRKRRNRSGCKRSVAGTRPETAARRRSRLRVPSRWAALHGCVCGRSPTRFSRKHKAIRGPGKLCLRGRIDGVYAHLAVYAADLTCPSASGRGVRRPSPCATCNKRALLRELAKAQATFGAAKPGLTALQVLRRRWSGCHRPSRAGSRIHRARLLGQCLAARDVDRQIAEFQLRVAVLNGFTALDRPVTEAVRQVRLGNGKSQRQPLCNRAVGGAPKCRQGCA